MKHLISLLFFPCFSIGQTTKIDSLKQIVFEYPVSELSTEELKDRSLKASLSLSYAFSNYYFSQDTYENQQEHPEIVKQALRQWSTNDSLLFYRAIQFIEMYSIPDSPKTAYSLLNAVKNGFGNEMVQLKKECFPLFYQKFQEGVLSNDQIWNFLFRLCQETLSDFKVNQNLNNYEQVEDMMIQLQLTPY